nr:VCBS domain-containing protein [Limnohabitans sp. T6-20]
MPRVTASTNGYGLYTMTAAGVWEYTVNNSNTTVQGLTGSQTLTDTFNVTAADGTIKTVKVTINGTNDAAVIGGATTGALTETNAAQTATGTLTATDVDGAANNFIAQTSTAGTAGYGTFSLTTAGAWSYNMNSAHNEFKAGQTYTDTFTAKAADGTNQTVTVTISGTNDAPVLTDTVLTMTAVLQGTGATPVGAVGMLVSDLVGGVSDVDTGAAKGIAITAINSAKGQLYYSLDAGSHWTELTDASASTARLLTSDANHRVYFKAAAGTSGTVADALTFRAWDGTTGTDGSTGNASVNDGTTAFSAASDTVSEYVVAPVTINVVSTDDLVNVSEPLLITGKADANAVVTLNINSQNVNVTANANGDWSYDGSKVRYIMVRKSLMNLASTDPQYDLKGILTIGEMEVYEKTTGQNVATWSGVTQTYSNASVFTTGSLRDMNSYYTAGHYVETSGSQMGLATGVSQDAWVQIDLGAAYSLSDIKLVGAENTNAHMNGAMIYTSATDMSTLTKAQLDSSVLVNRSTPVTGLTNSGWQGFHASADAIYGNLLSEGANTITASESVQGVNNQATRVVTLDTIAPVTTVNSAALSSDTGTSTTDFITSVAAQNITGTLSANLVTGEKVMVSLDNGVTWTAATTAVGTSTWSLSGVTLSGSSTLQAKVVDTAGNASAPYSHSYAYVPVSNLTVGITRIEDNAGTATNVLSGGTSNDTTPTLVGTLGGATQGAALGTNEVVNVYRTPNLATATVVQAGTLAGGQILSGNALTLYSNGDGNYGSGIVYLPTTPNDGNMVVINKGSGWGLEVYAGNTLVGNLGGVGYQSGGQDNLYFKWDAAKGTWLTGTNAMIKVGTATVTTNAAGQSIWTLTDNSGLGNSDSVNYIAQVENTTGTFGQQSTPGAFDWRYNVDNVAPSSISLIGTDDVGPVTGTITANGVTNDDKPTFSGSTEANAVVSVYDGTTLLGTTTANGSGAWSFTPTTALATGTHSVTAKATDASGNTSTASTALAFTVDTGTPTAVADVKDSDEDTTPITGSVATNDTNKDGSESYAIVGSAAGTYGTLTMNANGTYSYARSVVLDAIQTTAVETFTYKVTDAAGNTTQSTLTINMAPVNDAAVIAGDLLKTVSETNAAQTVTGALTITDVDSTQSFNALTGVVGTYGSFSMTTAGAWTYVMSSAHDEFKADTAYTDSFTVTAADGTAKVVSVTINGTNDGPVLVSTDSTFSDFYENGGAVSAKKGSIQLSDVDSDNLQGATVSLVDWVTNGFVTGDVLTYTMPSGASITGNYNTSTGVLTFTGSATKAQYEQLLNSVMFNNAREDLIGGARKVYWTVTDSSGQQSSTSVYSNVSVNRLNDAPVLTDTVLSLTAVQPATSVVAPTGAMGVLVSTLVGGITDADGTTVIKGIAVTKVNQALGQLFFSADGGATWFTYSSLTTLSEQTALLLKADASTLVYFRPNVGVEGTIADAFTIRAWDTTDNRVTLNGNQVTFYPINATGGTTPYSAATDTVSLTVATTATTGFDGTTGVNVMTGTTGKDVMVGNGGADQISAGDGNDKVVLNASNVSALSAVNTAVVNGGAGVNTLKLSGADMLLDMTLSTVQSKVDNFSVVDITGSGNNTLKLNLLNGQTLSGALDNAVTANVDEAQMLVVHGDSGDAVILENAASWTVANSLTGTTLSSTYGVDYGFVLGTPTRKYSQYTKNGVTLFVDDATAVADIAGTTGADVLTGTATADVIYGNGGADQINAGAGNDVVILNVNSVNTLAASNTAVVNGGAGVNSLKISGLNNVLDLTNATVAAKIDNFTVIDLHQGSGNKVKINLQDVLDLSGATDNLATVGVDESKMLVVQGNGGSPTNHMQLADSANWSKVTNLGGTTMINTYGAEYGFEVGRSYTQYTNGLANLFVDQSLIQTLL